MSGTSSHVLSMACGDSAAGAIVASGRCDADSILVQPDVLSCGPLHRWRDLDAWRRDREAFWLSAWSWPEPPSFDPPERYFLTARNRLADAERLVFWVGCGLSDQLMLASAPRILELGGIEPPEVGIVQFRRRPDMTEVQVNGLGSLTPEQIAMGPDAAPVDERQWRAWAQAWEAVTDDDPASLEALLRNEAFPAPLMRQALVLLLDRYPDRASGLAAWDVRLLEHVSDRWAPVDQVLGATLRAHWSSLDPVGDIYLRWRLDRMASVDNRSPLLEQRENQVRLARQACEALSAGANWVDLNGLDDWAGGVHLNTREGRVWFRDGHRLVSAP